jgi:hypothetical protein
MKAGLMQCRTHSGLISIEGMCQEEHLPRIARLSPGRLLLLCESRKNSEGAGCETLSTLHHMTYWKRRECQAASWHHRFEGCVDTDRVVIGQPNHQICDLTQLSITDESRQFAPITLFGLATSEEASALDCPSPCTVTQLKAHIPALAA